MHSSGMFAENAKVDVQSVKVDIQSIKVDIQKKLENFSRNISEKTICHALDLYYQYGKDDYFGRSCVEQITGLKSSGASKFIKILLDSRVIEPVKGHGKGKYHFL